MSISTTTRKKRSKEIEGKHYNFVTYNEYKEISKNNGFIEQAHVFGNYYGTQRKTIEDNLKKGHDILFDIDGQGKEILVKSDLIKNRKK